MDQETQFKKINLWTTVLIVILAFTLVFALIGVFSSWRMGMLNAAMIFNLFVTILLCSYLIRAFVHAKKNVGKNILPLGWPYLLYLIFRLINIISSIFVLPQQEVALPTAMMIGAVVFSVLISVVLALPSVFSLLILHKEGKNETI